MTQQEKANRMIRELRQNIIASVLLIGNLEDLMHIHSEVVYLSMCKTDADGNNGGIPPLPGVTLTFTRRTAQISRGKGRSRKELLTNSERTPRN